jgi:predicted Zn-dependent protease
MRKGLIFALSAVFLFYALLIAGNDETLVPRDKGKLGQAASLNILGHCDQAAEILKELHQRYPRDTEISIELLKAFGYGKRLEQTLALINEMEKQSLNPESMELIADILVINQQFERAQNYYAGRLKQNPSDNKFRLKLAEVLARQKKYPEAIALLKEISVQKLKDDESLKLLANVYSYVGDYPKAELLYRQILEHSPDFSTRKNLAEVLAWQKKYPEAIVLLKEIMVQKPKDDKTLELLADVYTWHKDYDIAIQTYQQLLAVRTGEKKKAVLLKLADALRYAGKPEEALQLYTQYLRETEK